MRIYNSDDYDDDFRPDMIRHPFNGGNRVVFNNVNSVNTDHIQRNGDILT